MILRDRRGSVPKITTECRVRRDRHVSVPLDWCSNREVLCWIGDDCGAIDACWDFGCDCTSCIRVCSVQSPDQRAVAEVLCVGGLLVVSAPMQRNSGFASIDVQVLLCQ